MPGPTVSLILPCYNEMEHIAVSLPAISRMLNFILDSSEFEIILVDDGSKDGTRQWLEEHKASMGLKVIMNEKNLGRGGAVKRGIAAAQGKICGFMDIDCEVSEAYLGKFILSISDGADFVVARRIYRISMIPYILARHVLSVFYRWMLNFIINVKTYDTEAGYKFFSQRAKELILRKSIFDNWFWDTEACYIMEANKMSIIEIPATFTRNPHKTSTVRLFPDIISYIRSLIRFLGVRRSGHYLALK